MTLSIGYSKPETISKSDIAIVQLNDAMNLFVDGNFISAITLAGAAEEILGKLLEGKDVLSISAELFLTFKSDLNLDLEVGFSRKMLSDNLNFLRNELKHRGEDVLEVNFCDEAFWMINRALFNAAKLDISVAKKDQFKAWCKQNVHNI